MVGVNLGGCQQSIITTKGNSKVVTIKGEIIAPTTDGYVLSTESGLVTITSTKFKLDTYLHKKVTVEGMYSGTLLYVDKLRN